MRRYLPCLKGPSHKIINNFKGKRITLLKKPVDTTLAKGSKLTALVMRQIYIPWPI